MLKKILQILFALFILFTFQLSFIYSSYNTMVEADFLWRGLKFEASDLGDLYVDKAKQVDFGSSLSSTGPLLEDNLGLPFFNLFSITSIFQHTSSILRI